MSPLKKNKYQDKKRLVVVSFSIFFLFALIIMQFYKLQIIEGNKWLKIANNQHQLVVVENFQRGCFYSNTAIRFDHPEEKIAFVQEVPTFHLFIDPKSIPANHKTKIAKKMFEFFKFSNIEKTKILNDFFKNSRSRKIISHIDKNKKNEIEKFWLSYCKSNKIVKNAIFFVQDYKRSYPFGSLLGQILHTVQEEKDPKTFQSLPTGGLEFYFNEFLKGSKGKRIITRSPRHSLDMGKVILNPQNGKDVYLTINHYLQAILEQELEKGVAKANAKGGWAIMMDPYNGEILALGQSPSFDLRKYQKYFNDENLKESTRLKAVTDPFEPGSIMKPITLAICMKANEEMKKIGKPALFYADEKIACSNGKFPGRSNPFKDTRHKYLNMYMATQKSSNIYFARLTERAIQRLGEKWYRDHLFDVFGFGQRTKIELPAEEPGLLPGINKHYSNGKPQWSVATPYSLAIGYNILVNGVQMVKAYSIIVNGGYDLKPTLLKKISYMENEKEIIIYKNKKNETRKRVLSEASCNEIKKAMKFSTKLGGTSRFADVYGYTEGGKSGTAEKNVKGTYKKDVHISSFIGFVPANKPRFVLMVVIDEPEKKFVPNIGKLYQGGVCAAPVFKEISTRSLKYLGVAPDDPLGYPNISSQNKDWTNEVSILQNTYNSWNK